MYRRRSVLLFMLLDGIGCVCAFLWAHLLYLGSDFEATRYNWEIFTDPRFVIPIAVIRLLIYEMCGLYDLDRGTSLERHAIYGVFAVVLAGLLDLFSLLMLKTFYEPSIQPSRGLMITYGLFAYGTLVFWRVLLYGLRLGRKRAAVRVLIVGAGEIGEQLWQEIERYSSRGHVVVGFIDDQYEAGRIEEGHSLLGTVRDMPRVVASHGVDEIIVASSQATRSEMLDLLSTCQQTGARVLLLPELYETMIGNIAVHPVAGIPLIELPSLNPGFRPPAWKRILDVLGAVAGLLVTAILHPFIAAAIRLDSDGPVFYSQARVGMHQRRYRLFKYRTMVVGAEDMSGPTLATDDDPRITRVGRWLRRLHLDELPQFWNVLRGEMSLVGPRPERPEFIADLAARVPAYRFRFLVRPGMTGLAQVYSYYASDAAHKLRYDISYMNTLSFLLDLKILFLTLKVLVTGRRIA